MQRISKLVSILLIFSALGCGKDAVTDKAVTEKAAPENTVNPEQASDSVKASAPEPTANSEQVSPSEKIAASITAADSVKAASSNSAPQDDKQEAERVQGQASWYGPGFYGKKTTSGEILKQGTLTAAHSSLPMGTKVKVTRLDNNKSVMVVINDRKPFKQGTVIDLAHGSATALDINDDGKTAVEVEVLD